MWKRLTSLLFCWICTSPLLATDSSAHPNILLIYADDLGYGDLGIQNPESKIPTPNLDALARQGMRFTDGHSSSWICTPSRYAMLTGRHHWRDFHGIVNAFGESVFQPERLTMPEMLQKHGYATACIGKWPGVTKAGDVSTELVSQIDLMATFADMLDIELPDDAAEDSHNMLPYLQGEAHAVRRSHVHNTRANRYALRDGDWLLIDTKSGYGSGRNANWEKKHGYPADDNGAVELYNLKKDIGQRNNVAEKHAEKVAELKSLLEQLRTRGHSSPRLTDSADHKGINDVRRPNIVFCMADDWSWPHAGILGDPVVKTPNFDRIAEDGVLFDNAFVSTPSCTPSRLSILTGQHHWRLREGDSLGGSLREEYDVYTEMLEESGYRIGWFGKGVWPSKHTFRKRDSFGERFRSFGEFLKHRKPEEPFCYWHGGQDPHRPYDLGVGKESGIDLSKIKVPACLPDNETVRSDVADYLWEVQRFDREVGEIVTRLKSMGELDNTILVVSGDNGMPFPRCKATLYDQGTRVPLAIRWGANVRGNRKLDDFVTLCDLAPTFLEAAGLKAPEQMTGRSLMPVLSSDKSGQVDPTRSFVMTGVERHVYSYPKRALRTKDFLYIRNFDSGQWPSGEIEGKDPEYDFAKTSWPTDPGAFSFAIDPSPTKQFLRLHRDDPKVKPFADLSFAKRPEDELYDFSKDPDQLKNVASDPAYAETRRQLRQQLEAELIKSADPRVGVAGKSTEYCVKKPPVEMKLAPFYGKYVDAKGYPIVSSAKVSDYALKEAAYLIDMMLAERPDIRRAMIASGSRMIVMAYDEFTTDVPEHSHLRPKDFWDGRARGLGGSRNEPVCSCAEENLLAFEGDPYSTENILIHEFAHNIHLRGMVNLDATFDDRLKRTFERAMTQGLWAGKYASTNHAEYFAEGVQSWFNNNRPPDHDHNHVDTRKELQEYDPGLASICEDVFGKTEIVYAKPTTRLKAHLAGYDPEEAPRFQWPKRVLESKQQTKERIQQQGSNRRREYKN